VTGNRTAALEFKADADVWSTSAVMKGNANFKRISRTISRTPSRSSASTKSGDGFVEPNVLPPI
jgi:hypothetical protein